MTRWQHLVFPLSQVTGAGLALLTWLIIGSLDESQSQRIAIASYAFGTPGSLVASLGIAYVLPNTFRNTPQEHRHGAGPWSTPLRIAVVASILVCATGLILSIIPNGSYATQVSASAFAMAGAISAGITVAQLGRTTSRLKLAIIGQLAVPATGVAWLASLMIADADNFGTRIACITMAASMAVLLCFLRGYLGDYPVTKSSLRILIRAALALLPHLLLFGILIQGVRIIAVIGGENPDVIQNSHLLMLAASVGFTLLASMNSFLAPQLQAAPDNAFGRALNHSLLIYGVAGLCSVIAALFSMWALSYVTILKGVSVAVYIYVGIAVLSCATYYSLSAQFMRKLKTLPLTFASASAAIVLIAPTMAGFDFDFTALVANFALASLVLTLVSTACSLTHRGEIRIYRWVPGVLLGAWILITVLR